VYFGELFEGLTHPFTHVLVVWPRLGGGDAGGEGGATGVEETPGASVGRITAERVVVG
jgi:hypothetical protein